MGTQLPERTPMTIEYRYEGNLHIHPDDPKSKLRTIKTWTCATCGAITTSKQFHTTWHTSQPSPKPL
jgi:hypothetical protein